MQVLANGAVIQLADGATLVDLIGAMGLGTKWVVAERNGQPVNRADMAATVLADGDRLELVRAVAGG
jgi:sulfur carrier protein